MKKIVKNLALETYFQRRRHKSSQSRKHCKWVLLTVYRSGGGGVGSNGTSVNYKIKYKPRNKHLTAKPIFFSDGEIFSAHIVCVFIMWHAYRAKCMKQVKQ